jgi:hypothetical protein
VFDVAVDGHVVFSKKKVGAFLPTPDVVELVRSHVEGGGA